MCVCVILFSYFSDFPRDFVILFFEIAVTECFKVAALYVIAFQHFVNWTGSPQDNVFLQWSSK